MSDEDPRRAKAMTPLAVTRRHLRHAFRCGDEAIQELKFQLARELCAEVDGMHQAHAAAVLGVTVGRGRPTRCRRASLFRRSPDAARRLWKHQCARVSAAKSRTLGQTHRRGRHHQRLVALPKPLGTRTGARPRTIARSVISQFCDIMPQRHVSATRIFSRLDGLIRSWPQYAPHSSDARDPALH